MEREEISQDRFKSRAVTDRFILIRGSGFLFVNQFKMRGFEFIIEELDMADDAQPIGKDGEFIGITEVTIDVLLF